MGFVPVSLSSPTLLLSKQPEITTGAVRSFTVGGGTQPTAGHGGLVCVHDVDFESKT